MAKTSRKEIKAQCRQIKRLWAEGLDDSQIKDTLHLSSEQWTTRLRYIASERYDDKTVILHKFETKMQKRYDQLEALSLTTNNERLRFDCIKEMKEVDKEIIDLGQKLGVFPQAAKSLNVKGEIDSRNASMVGVFDLSDTSKEFFKEVTKVANDRLRKRYLLPKPKLSKEQIERAFK